MVIQKVRRKKEPWHRNFRHRPVYRSRHRSRSTVLSTAANKEAEVHSVDFRQNESCIVSGTKQIRNKKKNKLNDRNAATADTSLEFMASGVVGGTRTKDDTSKRDTVRRAWPTHVAGFQSHFNAFVGCLIFEISTSVILYDILYVLYHITIVLRCFLLVFFWTSYVESASYVI